VEQIEPRFILPSDSSNRADAHHILNQEWDEAEASKHQLEDTQRADKRARDASKATRTAMESANAAAAVAA